MAKQAATQRNKSTRSNRTTKYKSKKSKGGTRTRRPTFYQDDDKRCAAILSDGKNRCSQDRKSGCNYCSRHETLRLKRMERHNKLIRSRGGKKKKNLKSKQIYEYDYYLDDEEEPFDSNAAKVHPKIWIGSIDSIHDPNYLKKSGVRSILNASGMEPSLLTRDMYRKLGIDYYTLSDVDKVRGKSHYKVVNYLGDERFSKNGLTPRKFMKYMHKACKIMNGKDFKFPVITNCHAGVNRSASSICAYLITKRKPYSYEKVVEMLKKANSKRNLDVLTNPDFRRALRYFPIFEGTAKNVSPQMLSRYRHYLKMYE
jgi:hypothetical protein